MQILSGIHDSCITDWISTERDRLLKLSFTEFMDEFHVGFLDKDWENKTRCELLSMTQGSDSFWTYAICAQAKNSLLRNTTSHLDKNNLRHQLEAGINDRLARKCASEKANNVVDFHDWLAEIKRIDDNLNDNRKEWEAITKAGREASRKAYPLGEPSRHLNVQLSTSSSTNTPCIILPKLTENKRKLFSANNGCFKCRTFFANHQSSACKSNFLLPIGYKTLSQADADKAKCSCSSSFKPVAVIQAYSNDENTKPSVSHPVATVLQLSTSAYSYCPSNQSSVLTGNDGESDSDGEVCQVCSVSTHTILSHLFWHCAAHSLSSETPLTFNALIDNGSHTVLIRDDFVEELGLCRCCLSKPQTVHLAMDDNGKRLKIVLCEYVKLSLFDPSFIWFACSVHAIIAPGLCAPVILGLPFLESNRIVIDHELHTTLSKDSSYDLLNPDLFKQPSTKPKNSLCESLRSTSVKHKDLLTELKHNCDSIICPRIDATSERVKPFDVVGAIHTRLEILAASDKLRQLGKDLIDEFQDVFSPILHIDRLPTDVYCRIKLKDANKTITTRSYSTPHKYREAWQTLIGQHLEAGRVHPSSSQHVSPAFIVPKADLTVLPRWVNDYRKLNANTIIDSHPLPHVDNILHDCGKGKIWSIMDMTNSFFQTRMHPDDIHLTVVTTPFGLYEWLVMPMGLRNSPPIHQHRMTATLREHIGKICRIYLDDIIIWSDNVKQHTKHIRLVLSSLRKASLFCNPKKCNFYQLDVNFLGHRISARGVEVQSSKVDKILHWPTPKNATETRSFLGLVRYISSYLPKLAEFTTVLTPLTTNEAKKLFPSWTPEHQAAFNSIKQLVIGHECLTVIDHINPGTNRIFITCDASDWRTDATLSYDGNQQRVFGI
jgi:hypothetical protein